MYKAGAPCTVHGQILYTCHSFSLDETLVSLVSAPPPRGSSTWTDEKSEEADTRGLRKKVLSALSEQIRGEMKEILKTEKEEETERKAKLRHHKKGRAQVVARVKSIKIS